MRGDKPDKQESGGYDAEFREYMVSRWGGLVRFAYGLTGDRGHAEDLAQTALATAYASWSRVRRAEDPDAYVRRILINANHRRFRKRRVEERSTEIPADLPVTDDGTAAFDEREALVAALMELPPKQRAVVVLRYWDGLTETQAAAVLGCSVGTVKSQASRALAKLRTSNQLLDGSVIS